MKRISLAWFYAAESPTLMANKRMGLDVEKPSGYTIVDIDKETGLVVFARFVSYKGESIDLDFNSKLVRRTLKEGEVIWPEWIRILSGLRYSIRGRRG